jgi:polar amino acid transport system substrate-binding protein
MGYGQWLAVVLMAALANAEPAGASDLKVLTQPLPPFTTGTATAPTGLAVEIVQAIRHRTGDDGPMIVEPFPRMLLDVQAGPMTAGFVVARTPPREHLMQWVGPLAVNGVYLYKKAGSPLTISTLEEARHIGSIGVTREDADHRFLREHGFGNLQVSESQEIDIKKLQLGRLDVTPMGEIVFSAVVQQAGFKPGDFEKTGVKLYDSEVYIALSPDVPKPRIDAWADALAALKDSGEYAELLAKYGIGVSTAPAPGAVGD